MSVQTGTEIRELLAETSDAARVLEAYALSSFAKWATYSRDFTASPKWRDAIVPTPAGEELLARVSVSPIQPADLRLAMFGLFWFEKPLVDFSRSNLDIARTLLEADLRDRRLLLPMMQGRILYDRYNSMHDEIRDGLTSEEISGLLHGIPQGIYQSYRIVSGPMGLMDSETARTFPPQMTFGLWHCAQVDCSSLHRVWFRPPPIPVVEGFRLLEKAAQEMWTAQSRWEQVLETWPRTPSEAWKAHSEIPLFLGDCIVGDDRTRLLARLLDSKNGTRLRAKIGNRKSKLVGNALAVSEQLTPDEQLQLLLTCSDEELFSFIDELVNDGEIVVPPSEVREVDPEKLKHYSGGVGAHIQLSDLGVRRLRITPILRLRSLIMSAYMATNTKTDLDWRLNKAPGIDSEDALVEYLRRVKPINAIETLVLTSQSITRFVGDELGAVFPFVNETTSRTIAWKLGFNVPREHKKLATLRRVLAIFGETVDVTPTPRTDEEREIIRSSGVNAFVELEGFIEDLICYVVWVLASDHPKDTRFVYSRSQASLLVSKVLGESLTSGGETVRWIRTGNTLGASIRYLQRLHEWISSLAAADRTSLKRPKTELNEWYETVITFPFNHIELWADANPDEISKLSEAIGKCATFINKSEATAIRNGLEHYREASKFPRSDKMSTAIKLIVDFVHAAVLARLVPRTYWIERSETDAFGQTNYYLTGGPGEMLTLHSPRPVHGLLPMSVLRGPRPVLIAPGNLFGVPNSAILFTMREASVYSEYWKDYPTPRVRQIVSARETDVIDEGVGS